MRDRDRVSGAPKIPTGTRSTANPTGDTGYVGAERTPQAAPRPNPVTTGRQGQPTSDAFQQGKQAADQAVGTAKEKAHQVADQATDAVDQGVDKAAEGLDMAADMLRDKGKQAGPGSGVQSSAAMVADKLDAASGYLRGKDSDQLVADLEALVRRKPTESLLVAAGLGFVLSKILR